MDHSHEDNKHNLMIKNDDPELLEAPLDQNAEDGLIDEDALIIFGDLEKILGDDPSQKAKKEINLHPTLVTRWKDWIVTGLSKEVIVELTEKYPRTGNCNLEAPVLNPEVMHSLKETAQKRDKHFVHSQNLAGTALSALGTAISGLLKEESIDKLKLLEQLSDAAKLLIEVHRKESTARIAYILPGMSKQVKAVLEETKPDTLLFGHGLTEKLQDAIALEKLGKELKAQQDALNPKKPNSRPPGSSNWKGSAGRSSGSANWKSPAPRPPASSNWKSSAPRQSGSTHNDNRSRGGPNRNFQQKSRQTPYQSGPLRQHNQSRPQNNRPDVHRRS